jgi:ABC-2 type transport system permease protein
MEINEGKLTNYLLRPVSYFKGLAARDLSDKLLNFAFTIFEVAILLLILRPPLLFQTNGGFLILAAIGFTGATILYFIISLLLSLIGFWTAEVWATRFIFLILLDFIAGNFFPIDILPQTLYQILLMTPFPYLFYFPVKLLLGGLENNQIVTGFIMLFFWLAVLSILLKWVWEKGLKVYSAEGR